SQLRVRGTAGLVQAYDALLRDSEWASAHKPDLVLRLGAPPTSKALSQLIARAGAPVVIVESNGWRDPDQLASEFVRCEPEELLRAVASLLPRRNGAAGWQRAWCEAGTAAMAALTARLAEPPLHEGQVVQALAGPLPPNARTLI